MGYKSILPPSSVRPKTESNLKSELKSLEQMITANFQLTTLLLVGGLFQGLLLLLVPRVWVLLPTVVILLGRFAHTLAVTFKLVPNPQMKNAMLYRTTALIPDKEGEFSKDGHPANEKVAVLLLGLRINHPLGFFAPGMKALGPFNAKMSAALDAESPENGFLGQTEFARTTEQGSQEVILLSYWRSIEDILKFSVGPSHRETWNWWDSNASDLKHIGISHEIFQADKAMYESVYINFQPTRLGATTYLRRGDEFVGGSVPDQWISPVVDASRGRLRNSKGRLGWSTEEEKDMLMEKQMPY